MCKKKYSVASSCFFYTSSATVESYETYEHCIYHVLLVDVQGGGQTTNSPRNSVLGVRYCNDKNK